MTYNRQKSFSKRLVQALVLALVMLCLSSDVVEGRTGLRGQKKRKRRKLQNMMTVMMMPTMKMTASMAMKKNGQLTWWTSGTPGPLEGSSCEFANPAATQQGSGWLTPYVDKQMYCAVNDALFNGGEGCGKCYQISYSGTGGTDPGRAGSAKIQVVNSGAGHEFDCFDDAFFKITGTRTGIFPVKYQQIACASPKPTVVVLDGNNAFYVKILVAGGTTGAKAVSVNESGTNIEMNRISGATWAANLSGSASNPAVKFVITWSNNKKTTLSGCFRNNWPAPTGAQCS